MSSLSPHRGVTILIIGIVSLVMCQLISPVAWIMGKGDPEKMDREEMDPEGRGMTQAGMIIGILGTILLFFGFLWGIAVVVFGASMGLFSSIN